MSLLLWVIHTLCCQQFFMRAVSSLESSYNESCWLWGLWNIQSNRDCRCWSWKLLFRAVNTTNTTFIKMLPNISDTIKTKLFILLFRFFIFLLLPTQLATNHSFHFFTTNQIFPQSLWANHLVAVKLEINKRHTASHFVAFGVLLFARFYIYFSPFPPALFHSLYGLQHILHVYRFVYCISKSTAVYTRCIYASALNWILESQL